LEFAFVAGFLLLLGLCHELALFLKLFDPFLLFLLLAGLLLFSSLVLLFRSALLFLDAGLFLGL
jgi:hypothetical protein